MQQVVAKAALTMHAFTRHWPTINSMGLMRPNFRVSEICDSHVVVYHEDGRKACGSPVHIRRDMVDISPLES